LENGDNLKINRNGVSFRESTYFEIIKVIMLFERVH
jgi:hypothetical protein